MRDALAKALYDLARDDPRVVVLVADISPAGAMEDFRREFPDRFVNVGIAEQAMIGVAAGLAQQGMRPVCYTIAPFALFRPYEFVRDDLAYQRLPVLVVGMGAGLAYSTLGGTHQAVEDVAVAMACPGLTVLTPCDPLETAECARWALRHEDGPVYMRIGKAGEPIIDAYYPWKFGKLRWVISEADNEDCIISYGPIAAEAVAAARALNWDVALTAFPMSFDAKMQLDGYDRVLVVEEALGAPLAHRLAMELQWGPKIIPVCIPHTWSHFNGTRAELLDHVGLSAARIVERVRGTRA